MTQGVQMGILSLLAIIGCVLSGLLTFFVYLGRKASQASNSSLSKMSALEDRRPSGSDLDLASKDSEWELDEPKHMTKRFNIP
jgi:hypothetical protein